MDDDFNITIRVKAEVRMRLERALQKARKEAKDGHREPSRADVYREVILAGLDAKGVK